MEKLDAALAQLAEKLGVASGHLWEVMVRQARVEAGLNLVWMAAAVCGAWWLGKGIRWVWEEDGGEMVAVILGIVGYGILLFVFGASMNEFATALFNPEYMALSKVLKAIS